MIAVAWTAIGLLAAMLVTLVGAILQLSCRIDGLAGRIDAHVERHAG